MSGEESSSMLSQIPQENLIQGKRDEILVGNIHASGLSFSMLTMHVPYVNKSGG